MKKFYRFAFVALAAVAALAVDAKGLRKFPKLEFKSQPGVMANAPSNIGPIGDKDKGFLFYAASLVDYSTHARGWYSFRSGEPWAMDKITTWHPGDEYNRYGLRCGTWGGDAYYGYFTEVFSTTELPTSFVKIDPATGQVTTIKAISEGEDLYDNWPMIYDMAWNPVNGDLYAYGQAYDDTGNGHTALYLVDRETGGLEKIYDFESISMGMAVDMDGVLWTEMGVYNPKNLAERTGTRLISWDPETLVKKDSVDFSEYGEKFTGYGYYGSMQFDHTTGKLYYIGVRDEYLRQTFFEVNTKTGELTSVGSVNGTYVGMYIPYLEADRRDAPAQVDGLTAVPNSKGELSDTLKWVNPSFQWNRDELKKLAEVLVFRKGTDAPVATLAASPDMIGKEMSWIDENAEAGVNTYYVVACSEKGVKGVKDSVRVYCGEDIPGSVPNISVAKAANGLAVSWDAPVEGINRGYVDPNAMTYDVLRVPDSVVVAHGIADRTFTDTNLGDAQMYSYSVKAKNSVGEGEYTRSSQSVFAGRPYTPPFSLGFDSYDISQAWTVIGSSGYPAIYWSTDQNNKGYMCVPSWMSLDDWLISPSMQLEGGKRYKVLTTIQTNTDMWPSSATHNFSLTYGRGLTAADQTNVMLEEKDFRVTELGAVATLESYIDASESGIYYYGFHATSTDAQNANDDLRFYGISVEEVHNKDLAVDGLDNIAEATFKAGNVCNVAVVNKGREAVSAYKVRIARVSDGGLVDLGEASKTDVLEPGQSVNVPVTFSPDLEEDMDIVGLVECEGDENEKNDTSEVHHITVLPEGTASFNVLVEGDGSNVDTRVPMSFVASQSTSQTIYLASELGNADDSKISRLAYEYDSNDGVAEPLGPVSVSVYMSNTDAEEFGSISELVPTSDQTLVYEGEVTVNPGKDQKMAMNFQTPFEYKKGKNLCITVVKDGVVGNDYPALFKIFNSSWNLPDAPKRTLRLDGYSNAVTEVPVLHLAVTPNGGGTGVEDIVAAPAVWYDAVAKQISFNGAKVKKAALYDVSGKTVAVFNLSNGASSFYVNVPAGLYIVSLTDCDGLSSNVKINVSK